MSSERFPDVAVAGDPQPRNAPFELGVETGRQFSPDAPALVRGWFENRSSTEQTVGFGRLRPFSEIWSVGESSLVLVPTDGEIQRYALEADEQIIPDRPVDGCWRTNPVRFVRLEDLRWRSLTPGERIRTEYAVLHYPVREMTEATVGEWFGPESRGDDCLSAGEYRFEESFPAKPRTETTWDEFEWGFTLTLEE